MHIFTSAFMALLLGSAAMPAFADEWVAERLRGSVMHLEAGRWTALERGDIVSDGQKVRTESNGRVELVRGQERIALAANTEIAIRDSAGQKMTSVMQASGSVTIEAERRNVQHFSLQTPVLAAVVKGTLFTVTYANGQARVAVERGVVQVQDNTHDVVADVQPGQVAEASRSSPLDVAGPGSDRVVYLIDGAVVPAAARDAVLSGAVAAQDALEARGSRAVPDVRSSASSAPQEQANGHASTHSNTGGASVGVGSQSANVHVNTPVQAGNINASVSAGTGGASVNAGVGGIAVGVDATVNAGNPPANGSGNGVAVGLDLGVVGAEVGVGGDNGLSLGLTGGNGLRLGLGL